MALAILEWTGWEKGNVRFRIDTGTNAYYQVKLGKSVRPNQGIDWVDDVFFATPVKKNEAGGSPMDSEREIAVAVPHFDEGKVYAQLFSYKNPAGKSPAFSRIVTLPRSGGAAARGFAPAFSMEASMNTALSFQPPRQVPCRLHREAYARQASLDDLLAGIIKIAAPIVLDLLKGGTQNGAGPTPPSGSAGANGNSGQANLLAQLLSSILADITGGAGKAVSHPQSFGAAPVYENRFLVSAQSHYSQPFIFGIDDAALGALIGPMIGPIVQILPQLLNSANQQRLQMKQTDNKLITDILSDVNRRRMLEQLLQAQQPPAAGQPDNAAAAALLQQLLANPIPAAAPPVPPAPPVAGAAAKILSLDSAPPAAALSSKAVLSFVTADPVTWNGKPETLFAQNQEMRLNLRLNVTEPAPKTPLPKAILKIVFKRASDSAPLYEKTFKQKGVAANAVLPLRFAPEELARLPVNTPLSVIAEMRWLSSVSGREYKALGSSEMILVGKYFLKEPGKSAGPERELTDMKRFRPFWNKVWEAPTLDAASVSRDGERNNRWTLDVNMKYSTLLSAARDSNGLMETKILRGAVDEERTGVRTEGRMKAGIELSLAEMNKLLPLWDGATLLDADKLQAFQTEAFARDNTGEFVFNLKLNGRAGERGMVWVTPVFALFDFPLSVVQTTNDSGQVTAVNDENVRFPMPVSARILGLKSQ